MPAIRTEQYSAFLMDSPWSIVAPAQDVTPACQYGKISNKGLLFAGISAPGIYFGRALVNNGAVLVADDISVINFTDGKPFVLLPSIDQIMGRQPYHFGSCE